MYLARIVIDLRFENENFTRRKLPKSTRKISNIVTKCQFQFAPLVATIILAIIVMYRHVLPLISNFRNEFEIGNTCARLCCISTNEHKIDVIQCFATFSASSDQNFYLQFHRNNQLIISYKRYFVYKLYLSNKSYEHYKIYTIKIVRTNK